MRKAAFALLLLGGGCSNNDNVIYGAIGATSITPFIAFDNVNSVISGRATLTDANGAPTGVSEVVIISDRPALCDRLAQHRDYFRNPPESYVALILFLPGDDRLGTFLPSRDLGTGSEIIGADPSLKDASIESTGKPIAPFPVDPNFGYIGLTDWSEAPGSGASGSFNLLYDPPAPLTLNCSGSAPCGFNFYGKFKSTVCTTLDGTQLP
jgi:hypothetical protein